MRSAAAKLDLRVVVIFRELLDARCPALKTQAAGLKPAANIVTTASANRHRGQPLFGLGAVPSLPDSGDAAPGPILEGDEAPRSAHPGSVVNLLLVVAAVFAAAIAANPEARCSRRPRRRSILGFAVALTITDQRLPAPAPLRAARTAGRPDGARRSLAPGRQPARWRGPGARRRSRACTRRSSACSSASRRSAAAHRRRRARGPGGGAGSRRPRPPRRGQPVADRAAPAPRGDAQERPARARRRARRDAGPRQPGDAGAADPGPPAAADRPRRPRAQGRARRPSLRAREPEPDRDQLSTPTASSAACPRRWRSSPTASPRRRCRTPPATPAPSTWTFGSSRDRQALELAISDDGRGFSFEEATRGLGLAGMRERALLVSGDLEIESRPDDGTRVRLRVPIHVAGNDNGEE